MLRCQGLDPPSCPLPLSPSPLFCSSIQARDPQINGEAVSGSESLQTRLLTHTKRNNPHAALIHPPTHPSCLPRRGNRPKKKGGAAASGMLACRAKQPSSYPDPTYTPNTIPSPKQAACLRLGYRKQQSHHLNPSLYPKIDDPPNEANPILAPGSQPDIGMLLFSQVYFHTLARLLTCDA